MKSNHRKRRQHLVCEILESRQLLAGDVGLSPWSHPLNPNDTNGDGIVSAVDALVVINQLNRVRSDELSSNAPPILGGAATYLDVNGDGQVTPVDALRVINQLNRDSQVVAGEAESPTIVTTNNFTNTAATDLVFRDHFARSSGVLSPSADQDIYSFTAHRDFVAVDLSSLAQESHAEVRVLDEFGVSLAVASELGERQEFEGFKFPTEPGRQYQIEVALKSDRAESFGYTIDVMQFDLQQWPSVQVSALPGFAWMNQFGTDAQIGDDIHSDVASNATLVRTFNQQARLQSNIDVDGDVDWFRIPSISNAVTIGVAGRDGLSSVFEVFDAGLNPLQPSTTISNDGVIDSASYFVDRPGEVWVRVAGTNTQTGRYELSVRDTGKAPPPLANRSPLPLADQVGNGFDDAAELTFTGTALTFEQRLETSDDVDVYRLPSSGVTNVIASGVAGIQVELVDAAGNVIERTDPIVQTEGPFDFANFAALPDGELDRDLYLRVWSNAGSVGRYQLTVAIQQPTSSPDGETGFDIFASSEVPDSQTGDDRHSSELLQSTRFTSMTGDTVISNLDSPDDVDTFYVFGISHIATFSVHTHEPMGIELTLVDRGGNVLEPLTEVVSGNSVGVSFAMPTLKEYVDQFGNPKKTLFVQVSSNNGSVGEYKLIRGFTPTSTTPKEIMGIDRHAGTVAEATPVTISPLSHDLASYLDGNDDRDAFEFTAPHSQVALTVLREESLGMRGAGTVQLYTQQGVLIEPVSVTEAPFKYFVSGTIEKTYELNAGEKYVAIVSNEQVNAKGGYRLRIEAIGNVWETLDLAEAETITIPDSRTNSGPMNIALTGIEWATVPLNVQLDGVDDVQLVRFTSSGSAIWANPPAGSPATFSDDPLRFRLFNLTDGTELSSPSVYHWRNDLNAALPSALDNVSRDYLLAVWSTQGAAAYDVDMMIGQRVVADKDTVGDTFADAPTIDLTSGDAQANFDNQDHSSGNLSTRMRVQLNSDTDVDMYRFEAINPITKAGIVWASTESFDPVTQSEAADRIMVDVFDENGVAVTKRSPQTISLSMFTIEPSHFETEIGKTYFLRVSQTTPNPISGLLMMA